MSSREWVFRIQDMLKSINKIDIFMTDMTFTQFKKNEMVLDAVIRNIEIIGEASKNIPVSVRHSYSNIPWDQMSGMRNILVHEYFGVDTNTVWHTAKTHLPALKMQLEAILKDIKK